MTTATLDEELLTYEQVARRLPLRIRYAIEEGMPCIGGHEHHWDTEDAVFMRRIPRPVASFSRRQCLRCLVMAGNPDYREEWRP